MPRPAPGAAVSLPPPRGQTPELNNYGCRTKKLPTLTAVRFTRSASGEWLAEFTRGSKPSESYTLPRHAAKSLTPAIVEIVDRIAEAVGSTDDRVWWARCVETLGPGAVDRGLGLLKEARQSGVVTNPGGLLTTFFKTIAAETGASIRGRTEREVGRRRV